jgi:NADPH-dependent 2,4-dienoyl-CoA reductase/sulfur reductase-like enzyme/rhodanese-related sulfurtransferase
MPVANLHHAEAIKQLVSTGQVGSAVVVGAGATGLEMAEALADLWGVETHIFEMAPHILPGVLDAEMAAMAEHHLRQQEDIHLHLGQSIDSIEGDPEEGVRAVMAGGREIECDLVLLATGVRPNVDLARACGLELAENGAIKVDRNMRTSDPDIFAAGDCVSMPCRLTGREMYMPSGSLANRQGRVVGTNVCGGQAEFPGVLGSFCIKLFGLSLACTGLHEERAVQLGLETAAPLVVQADRAHFHPDQKLMYVKLVVEQGSRRLLGLTAMGENGDAVVGRINAMAGLLAQGAGLEELCNLELAYSPPLGAALDIVNAAANAAENLLEGRLRAMPPEEFSARLARREAGDTVFLDMRTMDNAAPYLKALAPAWKHLPQETLRHRLEEVPKDKDVVLICNSGVRSYEAQCTLREAGFANTYNLSGGVAAVKHWGEPIIPQDET